MLVKVLVNTLVLFFRHSVHAFGVTKPMPLRFLDLLDSITTNEQGVTTFANAWAKDSNDLSRLNSQPSTPKSLVSLSLPSFATPDHKC